MNNVINGTINDFQNYLPVFSSIPIYSPGENVEKLAQPGKIGVTKKL